MNVVRNLFSDLVARRLWPVAAVLVALTVAVPVIVVGGAEEVEPPRAAPPTAAGVQPAVSPGAEQPRGGRGPIGRNPFEQREAPAAPAAPDATPTAPAAPGVPAGTGVGAGAVAAAPTLAGSTGGTALSGLDDIGVVPVDGGSSSPSQSSGDRASADDKVSYAVDLRIGRDGDLRSRKDVARLSPLPSQEDPFFVFLGVAADGETALFLISSDATVTGDGTCRPTPEACDLVEMKAGQTELFDVATPDGQTVKYQLEVTAVRRVRSADTASASAARARESAAGRRLLRSAMSTGQVSVSDLAFSRDLGLVVPVGGAAQDNGGLFGGYRVDLRFGPGDSELVKRYNLARLTPLPSVDEPSLIFLGVLADGATAIFLNPSGAVASGAAVCHPSPDECSRVLLGAGESALLDIPRLDGTTAEYRLEIDGITPLESASLAEAAASRARESKAGRVVLRRLITEVGTLVSDLNYSKARGVVVGADRPRTPADEAVAAPAPAKEEQAGGVPASEDLTVSP